MVKKEGFLSPLFLPLGFFEGYKSRQKQKKAI
jgi:hypothetical protein